MYGVDLAEWVAANRIRALLDLVEQLPSRARLWEAQANDPDAAREYAEHTNQHGEEEPAQWTPRLSEWDITSELLARVETRLSELIGVVVAMAGGKSPKVEPFPRPRTALEQARAEIEKREANQLLELFGFSKEQFF